ncbi:hypothetical protein [Histophilus somni]|uniref:hypothetical protein n=1 Tax=Histophilus somni TaxID=731 RepID=UPI00201EFE4E|nr:hypothetical protein [Histophilus somni]
MEHQIDFNHFIDITYSITSWEDSKSIQQDLLLGESRNLTLYTYEILSGEKRANFAPVIKNTSSSDAEPEQDEFVEIGSA